LIVAITSTIGITAHDREQYNSSMQLNVNLFHDRRPLQSQVSKPQKTPGRFQIAIHQTRQVPQDPTLSKNQFKFFLLHKTKTPTVSVEA